MKLVKSPTLMAPVLTRIAPRTISVIFINEGIASIAASNDERTETASIRALRRRDVITANRSVSRFSAPNDLTTITPSKLSWTA